MEGKIMPGYADLKHAFDELGVGGRPVIVHASLKKFGHIAGGPKMLLQALLSSSNGVIVPAFTYKTMVTPEVGPPNNGIVYGSGRDLNKMAEPFRMDMPPDKMMGVLPAALLAEKGARRTSHPILSFGGLQTDEILLAQTLFDPLAPIRVLTETDGWVVLINVDHTSNTSIHYAESLAGRRGFVRWALMPDRIIECPRFPGDSSGFNAIEEHVRPYTRRVEMEGGAFIQAVPLKRLIERTVELIKKDPLALLCQREDCERCNAVRDA
ncbi:MAG: AAC(3) family N-acetyltransferase [Chloroflexi bacterium]|nr:AAC(3) family N-acetyltransferase [Chloroflexota bacterium]